MPSGGSGGGFGQVTSGLVTAVSGTTITVQVTGQSGAKSSTKTVEVAAATVYSTSVKADSSAITVGLCAAVQGASDNSGTVTAKTLALSEAGTSGCTQGAGAGGVGGGPSGNGATNG
jgi:hypothetical protein